MALAAMLLVSADDALDERMTDHVAERTEIGRDFFVEIAGQKTERFAGFDGRAGQNDTRNFLLLEGLCGHCHRQVSLAGACRADAESDIMLADRFEVLLLADGLWSDGGLFDRGLDAVVEKALERGGAFVFDDVQG